MALVENIEYSVTGQWGGTFTATTNTSDGGNWLSATMTADKIIVSAEPNPTYSTRTGSVTIKYNTVESNELVCKVINVSQNPEGCVCTEGGGLPVASPTAVTIPQTGLTDPITVTFTASCGNISSISVNNPDDPDSRPWATVTSGGTSLNRTVIISNVGAYTVTDGRRRLSIAATNTGVDSCVGGVTLTQYGPGCDCNSIAPTSMSISSIPDSGLATGRVIATYTHSNNCSNVTATLKNTATNAQYELLCSNGNISLIDAIPVSTASGSTPFNLKIYYNDVECTAYTVNQSAVNCPGCLSWTETTSSSEKSNIPRAGVDNDTWFYVTTFRAQWSAPFEYPDSCFEGTIVRPIIHQGQFLTDVKVERDMETPAQGVELYVLRVYVKNVPANTSTSPRTTDCRIWTGPSECLDFNITQDGDGCGCSTYYPYRFNYDASGRKIPQSGLPANTVVATYTTADTTCSAITAVIQLGNTGATTSLTCSNGEIKLTSAIPANSTEDNVKYVVRISYGSTSCASQSMYQSGVSNCQCLSPSVDTYGDFMYTVGEIPQSGVGDTWKSVYTAYIDPTALTEVCYDKVRLEYITSSPDAVSNVDLEYTIVTGSWSPAPSTTITCPVLTVKLKNVPQNQAESRRTYFFGFIVNETVCGFMTISQAGLKPCNCNYFIEHDLIRVFNTAFSNGAHNHVLIASGNTNGCGSLEADLQNCEFMSATVETSAITVTIDGQVIEIDKNYYWYADIEANTGYSRNCSLYFTYIDRSGNVQDCTQYFMITQSSDFCDCPIVPTINETATIDGENKLSGYYTVTSVTGVSLSLYPNDGSGYRYMCQYVLGESDAEWCSAYTSYNAYYQGLDINIKAKRNTTGAIRTATIRYFSLCNPIGTQYGHSTTHIITENTNYSKFWIDGQGYNYTECADVGTLVITQQVADPCTCQGFGLRESYIRDIDVERDHNYAVWGFDVPSCIDNESSFTYSFIDESGNTISQPSFISDVYTYFDTIPSTMYTIYASFDENETVDERTIRIKITLTVDGGTTCEEIVSATQRGCNCSQDVFSGSVQDIYVNYNNTYAYGIIGRKVCGIEDCSSFTVTMYSCLMDGPMTYDWISFDRIDDYGVSCRAWFRLNENNTSSARKACFMVSVNGMDCGYIGSVTQGAYVDPCTDCQKIKCPMQIGSKYCNNDTDIDSYFKVADINTYKCGSSYGPCTEVAKLGFELVGNGWGTSWVSAYTNSNQTELYAAVIEANGNSNARSAIVMVKFLKSDGVTEVLPGCSGECYIRQDGTVIPTCNCNSVSYDSNHMTIDWTGTTTFDGQYYTLTVPKDGLLHKIGYIAWNDGLPDCLSYTTIDQSSGDLSLTIQENANRTLFDIYAQALTTGTNSTAASSIVRIDNRTSQECSTPEWVTKYLQFVIQG